MAKKSPPRLTPEQKQAIFLLWNRTQNPSFNVPTYEKLKQIAQGLSLPFGQVELAYKKAGLSKNFQKK